MDLPKKVQFPHDSGENPEFQVEPNEVATTCLLLIHLCQVSKTNGKGFLKVQGVLNEKAKGEPGRGAGDQNFETSPKPFFQAPCLIQTSIQILPPPLRT
jgi:hypothetical protein